MCLPYELIFLDCKYLVVGASSYANCLNLRKRSCTGFLMLSCCAHNIRSLTWTMFFDSLFHYFFVFFWFGFLLYYFEHFRKKGAVTAEALHRTLGIGGPCSSSDEYYRSSVGRLPQHMGSSECFCSALVSIMRIICPVLSVSSSWIHSF